MKTEVVQAFMQEKKKKKMLYHLNVTINCKFIYLEGFNQWKQKLLQKRNGSRQRSNTLLKIKKIQHYCYKT